MAAVLGTIHGLDFLFTLFLLGSVIFRFGILSRPSGYGGDRDGERSLFLWAGLAAMSSWLWLLFSAAEMADSWAPGDLGSAISQTSFGRWGCARVAVLMGLSLGGAWLFRRRAGRRAWVLGALGVPLISSLNGHAAAQGGAWIFLRVAVDWLHAAAVGIWTGGLWSLHAWLGSKRGPERMDDDQTSALEGVRRFSRWAAASTGVIAATGVLMAVWAGVDLAHPWRGGAYGRLVLAKTALFAGTLGVAGVNQFIHLRGASSPTLRMPEDSFRRRVRREVRFELILVGITLIVAGFLTRSDFP